VAAAPADRPLQGAAELAGAAHGPQRVVLVQPGDAEDGRHGVPDELLDGAAMPRQHLGRTVVVAGDHLPERLGVEPLAQRGRAHQITEDHRDGLADRPAFPRRGHGRAAGKTEPGRAGFSSPHREQIDMAGA
jgi:hypothetical protein